MNIAILTLDIDYNHNVKVDLKIGTEVIRQVLPSFSRIKLSYEQWQKAINQSNKPSRLEAEEPSNSLPIDYIQKCAEDLETEINHWLDHDGFKKGKESLLRFLESSKKSPSRIIIKTDDLFLQRVPWYCWNILSEYSNTEITLSSYSCTTQKNYLPPYKTQLKLLILLGDRTNFSPKRDQDIIENLKRKTHIKIDVFPATNRKNELCNIDKFKKSLENILSNGYDIIFFVGHGVGESAKPTDIIRFNINNTHLDIKISELKKPLNMAIKKGLRLAIFNSCLGMEIGHTLDQNHALTTIVMREKIRDDFAIEFLDNFLKYFYSGQPLCLAVKEAREKLPINGHNWLPVIFQKESEESIYLKDWILPNILELLFNVGLTGFNFGLVAIFISSWVSTIMISHSYWLAVLIICGIISGVIFAFFPYLSKHKYLLILGIVTLGTSIVFGLIYGAWAYVYSFLIALFSVFAISVFCLIYYLRHTLFTIIDSYLKLSQK
ncbi:adenylate cyclase [Nodularia spumigena CS-584]|jgi:hypothetical protein|uniref:CHAT domain-containing protein n=1 Tax=Nodularia spumigena UHCC 0039 TaxID=1914872 RepID=A0A2S0Q539_NODSP|nr:MULTISPECIES: hypothetical protein [Cyanophyceae]MDB9357802.1 adenylate cyclase [Nodularia spumigena CS-587/03]MDB9499178.1 adenylate cyclase [Nodularia spumigena CS-336/02]MEA5558841.1 adenylate cyclase [Nodularia spumigena CH309]AHJ29176.1 putative transmembrane sensor domain [Nodularia spumigena CCY9414]AVZ31466.1 hypothetical protein BMF81_04224 [Nodularia spumigena UHCC 0039]